MNKLQFTNSEIVSYTYKENWIIDIIAIDGEDYIGIWLSHKDIGIKSYMFGINTEYLNEIEDIIIANIHDYIKIYMKENMD